RLARRSIVGRPLDYLRFVWATSHHGLFAPQTLYGDFYGELERRAKDQAEGAAGDVGGSVAGGVTHPRPPPLSPRGSRPARFHRALRSWLPWDAPLVRRAACVAGLFLLGVIVLALHRGRHGLAFVTWGLSLYWLGTMVTVALVELTIPRYLFPGYFVVYLGPLLALTLLLHDDVAPG